MCISCHIKLSDKEIYNYLKNCDENSFKLYNSTSISHLILSSSGFNGEKNRNISINFMIKYYHWNIDKNEIIDNDKLSNIIRYLINNKIENTNKNKTKEDLLEYIQKIN